MNVNELIKELKKFPDKECEVVFLDSGNPEEWTIVKKLTSAEQVYCVLSDK